MKCKDCYFADYWDSEKVTYCQYWDEIVSSSGMCEEYKEKGYLREGK